MREPAIVYEDNHIIVINKPNAWLSQKDSTGDICIIDWVKSYLKERNKNSNPYCQLVHRLDRPVSGLLLLAKSSKALVRLQKMFQNSKITKIYWALVSNMPPKDEDTLKHWLSKHADKNTVSISLKQKKSRSLVCLYYRLEARIGQLYLLEIDLLTGKKHQIRAQLSSIGCAIRGDIKYGYKQANSDKSIDLHAYRLAFNHPITEAPLDIKALPPRQSQWIPFRNR